MKCYSCDYALLRIVYFCVSFSTLESQNKPVLNKIYLYVSSNARSLVAVRFTRETPFYMCWRPQAIWIFHTAFWKKLATTLYGRITPILLFWMWLFSLFTERRDLWFRFHFLFVRIYMPNKVKGFLEPS